MRLLLNFQGISINKDQKRNIAESMTTLKEKYIFGKNIPLNCPYNVFLYKFIVLTILHNTPLFLSSLFYITCPIKHVDCFILKITPMKTFQMAQNTIVEISVQISSDASVGSYVSMNDNFKKRSTQYKFSISLGNSEDLKNEIVSEVSNFFTNPEIIDLVMEKTSVICTITDGVNTSEYVGVTEKMTNRIFVHYLDVKLI